MKVTGTGLKKILSSRKDVRENYFLELLSARISLGDDSNESALDRGVRLEPEAIEKFSELTGKKVDQIGFCERDDNPFIASSPDGLILNNDKYTEAVEVKCLSSKEHVAAWLADAIPDDYLPQVAQYFIVNDDLETLYFVLYDPRVTLKPIHVIEFHREDNQEYIEVCRQKEELFLEELEAKVEELINF